MAPGVVAVGLIGVDTTSGRRPATTQDPAIDHSRSEMYLPAKRARGWCNRSLQQVRTRITWYSNPVPAILTKTPQWQRMSAKKEAALASMPSVLRPRHRLEDAAPLVPTLLRPLLESGPPLCSKAWQRSEPRSPGIVELRWDKSSRSDAGGLGRPTLPVVVAGSSPGVGTISCQKPATSLDPANGHSCSKTVAH